MLIRRIRKKRNRKMRVSELDDRYLADYLRLDDPEEAELRDVETALEAAKAYAGSYTGLSEEEMDRHEDITVAVLVLAADMFENRNLYLDYKYKETNRAVECILGMHSMNLI